MANQRRSRKAPGQKRVDPAVSAAAAALGRLGAAKGARKAGQVRMALMTPEERSEFGRRAIAARWERYRKQKAKTKGRRSS